MPQRQTDEGPARAALPPLKWAGGKRWQLPHLREIWAPHAHRRLVEPFCGGLAVVLGLAPGRALLNDANPHLINFYRWAKRGLVIDLPLENEADAYYAARARFNDLIARGRAGGREAAALFYYLNRTGYNGLCRFNSRGEFNVPFGRYARIRYRRDFSAFRDIFRHWSFRTGDFETLAVRPDDFVYADPPYDVPFTRYAREAFSWDDQVRAAEWLARHPGPVVLTNQSTERVRRLYARLGFEVTELAAPRRISCTGDRTAAAEVVAVRNVLPSKAGRPLAPRRTPMSSEPLDLKLDVIPRSRFDMVDLRGLVSATHGAALAAFSHCLYWSSHTTAGFLDRSMASRLLQKPGVAAYIDAFRAIFPEGADYEHDRMERRVELAPEQRIVEPRNADSHLAFIAAGLRTCVTYANKPDEPVCFVDLDGVNAGKPRRRHTRVIGYHREDVVARRQIEVPVSSHPVDSINLKDPRLGIAEELAEFVQRHGVPKGRLRLALHPGERHAGLTVNEYETLLMRHDLPEVLRDPLRFAIEKGRHAIADPRAVPAKTIEYAKYDLVRVLNQAVERLGLSESLVERLIARMMAVPANRFLRMKRSVNLLVSDEGLGKGSVVEGTYQSTILVQWHRADRQSRLVDVTLTRLH
jgi:DNA adenine methylase Dam